MIFYFNWQSSVTVSFSVIISENKKNCYYNSRKKEKMKNTKEIRNIEFLKYFKIIEDFLSSDFAIAEISEIIENFNIRRKLSIFQDIFEVLICFCIFLIFLDWVF